MGFRSFKKMASDSNVDGNFLFDWKKYYNEVLLPTYIHQPLIARRLIGMGSGTLIPVDFDGRKIMEIPKINDVDDPGYAMDAGEKDTGLSGDVLPVKMPQIYETFKLQKDEMKIMFAGKDRVPLTIQIILKKVAEFEDKKAFQGSSALGVNGLLSSDAYSLGGSAGSWGTKNSTTNVLTYAETDFNTAIAYFAAQGLADKPIDVVLSSYIWTKLKQTRLPYSGGQTNFEYLKASLNGGEILMTNNIQTGVSTSSNSAVFIVRDPTAWALVSSGIDQEQEKLGLWSWRWGIREKLSVKVLNNKYVAYMSSITTL